MPELELVLLGSVELGVVEVEDWFQGEESVVALVLVLAEVDALDELVVADGSVAEVLEDLMLLLQPLRANPARIMVNNNVVFIGGLICAPTDPGLFARFSDGRDV